MAAEEERVLPALFEDLVEKIIAMMPFPFILKGRCLSKSWYTKFSALSSLSTAEEKVCATSFQKEVTEWSNRWPTFSPVCATRDNLVCYDQKSQRWRSLNSWADLLGESTLMENDIEGRETVRGLIERPLDPRRDSNYQMEGVLLQTISERGLSLRGLHRVTNIFTGVSKELPAIPQLAHLDPDERWFVRFLKIVIDSSSGTYKSIVRYNDLLTPGLAFLQVYDSKSETWSSETFPMRFTDSISSQPLHISSAYLNGILYLVSKVSFQCLLAFNVKDETMKTLHFPLHLPWNQGWEVLKDEAELVVCNGNLMMIAQDRADAVHVLQIDLGKDLELLSIWEVAQRAHQSFRMDMIFIPFADTNCIFYKWPEPDGRMVTYRQHCIFYTGGADHDSDASFDSVMIAYNEHTKEWSFFDFYMVPFQWDALSFQPSLNTFIAP